MAFRNPWLLNPAREIRERLGGGSRVEGEGRYVGIHVRIGDGEFMRKKWGNVERIWGRLGRRLGLEEKVLESVWREVGWNGKEKLEKRGLGLSETEEEESIWGDEEWDAESVLREEEPGHGHFQKRSSTSLKRRSGPTTSVLNSLTCRRPLHTAPHLLAFNTPLYLATDSRTPTQDPTLQPFFKTFPCTFILSDFQFPSEINQGKVVESVGELGRLVNVHDGIELGRLFVPFLEAMVAAMGSVTVGTEHSTFSGEPFPFFDSLFRY